MKGSVHSVCVSGIRAAVPKNTFSNQQFLETTDDRRLKKQIKLTGIQERRVSIGGQKASDLAAIAADNLLDDLEWNRDTIDVLVFVTQSPDLSRPASAMLIQDRLRLGKNCLVYDINMGCAGFIGGMETVVSLVNTTKGRGLLLVGESNAVAGDVSDHNSFLDGDAAAAIAFEYHEDAGNIIFEHFSDGSRAGLLYKSFGEAAYMDGNAVMYFTLGEVADACKRFVREHHLDQEEIDYYVFHQAQKMIVDGIVNEMGIPEDKVLISCDKYGNTSSASIPLTIVSQLADKTSGTKKVFTAGFGIGLSWGMAVIDLDTDCLKPVIESDYVYSDRDRFGRV